MPRKNTLTELKWVDVRKDVYAVNSELAQIIDAINPSPKHTLFKATYQFGEEILNAGHLQLPDKTGNLSPLLSNNFDQKTKTKLGYNIGSNPVSIILENTAEIFIILENHTIPLYGLISPGKIFGTWRVLSSNFSHHPAFIWNITAGARSLFMLPKICENIGHEKIEKAFKFKLERPLNLINHSPVFKKIAHHPEFKSSWQTTILFFSDEWFKKLDDPVWQPFELYMLKQAWAGSEFWRNQFIWNISVSLIQKYKKLRPSPFDADTVKHLITMAAGAVPGFVCAINNEAGPVKEIQEIYQNIYQSKYDPIIMQPFNYSLYQPTRPVYYSLQYPSTLEFSPRAKQRKSIIADLDMVSYLLYKYSDELALGTLNLQGTPINDVVKLVNFDFFHSEPENYPSIKDSRIIPIEDKTFVSLLSDANRKDFPIHSPFLKGCIRISPKIKDNE